MSKKPKVRKTAEEREATPVSTVGCLGKIGYRSKADAILAMARINARRQEKSADLSPYYCRKCGRHHLVRRPNRAREIKRAPDWQRDSFKNRKARYEELTKA